MTHDACFSALLAQMLLCLVPPAIKTFMCVCVCVCVGGCACVLCVQAHAEQANRCPGPLVFSIQALAPGIQNLVAQCSGCGLLHVVL